MKSMLKSELAHAAGVSMRTFSRWLSNNEEELARLGVTKQMRLLPPIAVRRICELYGIDLSD